MIRAVVFDCFGVLAGDGWLPFKEKYFGHDAGLMEQATTLNKQTDAGLISFDDFMEGIAQLAHVSKASALKEVEQNPPNVELFRFINQLKPNYKVGMLSNVAGDWLNDLFSNDQIALFDATALSYETKMLKPDIRAYEVIADRLGVLTSECIMVDDQERYCTGATEAGMQAIRFIDNQQTITALQKLLTES